MPVIVDCRSCGRKLRVTDELLGCKVQCPSCGEKFDVASSAPEPAEWNGHRTNGENGAPAAEGPLPTLEIDREPPRCLRCGEPVGGKDVRCDHCGADPSDDDDRPWDSRRADRFAATANRSAAASS